VTDARRTALVALVPIWVGGGAPFAERAVQPQLDGLHVRVVASGRHAKRQVVTGAVELSGHAVPPGNSYLLAVVDNRSHDAVDVTSSSAAALSSQVTEQTYPALRDAFARYDFLRVLNADDARCLRFPATARAQRVSFRAVLAPGAAPVSSADLTVALVFTGPKDEDWWASHWG
jgi:hypothetical protein